MFPIVSMMAQAAPPAAPQEIQTDYQVRPLPGQLDDVLMFNSNSPEVVQSEGILLSTFPKSGKDHPQAHLGRTFAGRFDLFAHHIAKAESPDDLKTLYLGVMVHNPGTESVTLDVLQAASYLSQPDAPFEKLPPVVDNPDGRVYAGPGDRVTNEVLRGQRQEIWPAQLSIPPGESRMLLNIPIPVKTLEPPINGRSTLARLRSSGPLHVASLARFAATDASGEEVSPSLEDWQTLLKTGNLAGPRDKAPTVPGAEGQLIYGRVAGVARGSVWNGYFRDPDSTDYRLTIPKQGEAFAYPISALDRGTFGTGQIQSAPLSDRYPDTAYAAHGNYGLHYQLALPLYNPTQDCQFVSVHLETPLKTDEPKVTFFDQPPEQVFFRGTVRTRFRDEQGTPRTRYTHLVQFRGQQSPPLVDLQMCANSRQFVQVDLIYPPDATPPQILTIKTKKWLYKPDESSKQPIDKPL